jgi:hypothetical protein
LRREGATGVRCWGAISQLRYSSGDRRQRRHPEQSAAPRSGVERVLDFIREFFNSSSIELRQPTPLPPGPLQPQLLFRKTHRTWSSLTNIKYNFRSLLGQAPRIIIRLLRDYPRNGGPTKTQATSSKSAPYCIHKRFVRKKALWLQSGLFCHSSRARSPSKPT